jgi:carboxypeptidase D
MALLDTFPQLINFDPKVYDYFAEQFKLCGFNFAFAYPETQGPFPTLELPGNGTGGQRIKHVSSKLKELVLLLEDAQGQRDDPHRLALEKRQGENHPVPPLTGKINGWYGCYLVEELLDFAHNYTIPWRTSILPFACLC